MGISIETEKDLKEMIEELQEKLRIAYNRIDELEAIYIYDEYQTDAVERYERRNKTKGYTLRSKTEL